MPFLKLDCGILQSSVWLDRDVRDVWLTALLMATPFEITVETGQLAVDALTPTGFMIPPGWYGFVAAAGPGIANTAGVSREVGLAALRVLGDPDPESRSTEFEGRRLCRINGGYLVLSFFRWRDRDVTGAERQARLRERRKAGIVTPVTRDNRDVTCDNRDEVTHTEYRVQSSVVVKDVVVVDPDPTDKGEVQEPHGEQGSAQVTPANQKVTAGTVASQWNAVVRHIGRDHGEASLLAVAQSPDGKAIIPAKYLGTIRTCLEDPTWYPDYQQALLLVRDTPWYHDPAQSPKFSFSTLLKKGKAREMAERYTDHLAEAQARVKAPKVTRPTAKKNTPPPPAREATPEELAEAARKRALFTSKEAPHA